MAPRANALITIHLRDGDTRDVRIPDRRKRWAQVQRAVEACDWVRLEVFGLVRGKREMIGVIEAEGEEDASGVPDGVEDLAPSKEHQILALLIKAQDMALARYEKITTSLLERQNALVDTVIRSVNATADIYAHALGVARDQIQEGEPKSMAQGMLESVAPMIARQMMGGGAPSPATPPNGKAG